MCSSLFVFAAESDIVPYGNHIHVFTIHHQVGKDRENKGPHTYCEIDEHGNEICKNDCQLYAVYEDCEYACTMCNAVEPGSQHRHWIGFEHSKNHE